MSFNKETGMYEGYIYKIVNDVNDKVYIGQTRRTIEERWNCHIYDARNRNDNMIIHKSMNKYGIDNFHPIIIEKIIEDSLLKLIEKLNKKEKFYISKFNTVRPSGYNISIGGNVLDFNKVAIDQYDLNCNYIDSFDSIANASFVTGIPRASIEKCVSEVAISNKSAYGFVFVKSGSLPYQVNESNRKVSQYDLNGKFIRSYNSIKEASDITGISSSNINYCCQKQKYKTAGKYIWRYIDDMLTEEEIKSLNNRTYLLKNSMYPAIKQYDIFGQYIKTYQSVSLASQVTTTSQAAIISCCFGKVNTANKYVWRFIEDNFEKYNIDYTKKISIVFPYINMYSLDDEFIKSFISPTEAILFIQKKSISAICNCCNHINKTAYGYKWFWIFDKNQPNIKYFIPKSNLYTYLNNTLRKEK